MSALLVLAKLRSLEVLRSATSTALFMLLPLVLLGVIGVVFGSGHPFERRHVAIVASDEVARSITTALEGRDELRFDRDPTEAAAVARLRSRMASAVVVAPDGRPARLLVGPRDEIFGLGLRALLPAAVAPPAIERVAVSRWGYVHYLFPGLLTFSVLLAGLFGMGHAMVRFRQSLFLKKLATTPLPRSVFVLAQILARSALVLGQVVLLIVAARVLFGVPIGAASFAWLVLLSVVGLVVFMGAGFALACAVESEGVMVDVINAVVFPLVLLSEIFFPVDDLPGPLPELASALPSTQMVRLTRAVLVQGVTDPRALSTGLLIMAAWGVVTYALSVALFRWHR